jgi:Pentapeptide repeats (8 copies)
MFQTPQRKSTVVVVAALVTGAVGYYLLRLPAHRLEWLASGWPWLTPGRVNAIGYVLLAAATVVLLIGCLTAFPAALVPPSLQPSDMQMTANEYITAQNDARSTLVNALAGLLLLVTAIFTWRQLAISQEAQVTERYTRAVELLGNPDLAVRVGAVHSLGRLSLDSPKDDRSIYTLLTAYIRSHSPRLMLRPAKEEDEELDTWTAWEQRQLCEQHHAGYGSLQKCAADVQAALGVLADHPETLSDGAELASVLVDTRLPGAIFGHAKLARADLRGALLDHLDCRTGDRPYASFKEADFRGASLLRAQFGRADLREARLEGADLTGAALGTADLRGATYDGETDFPTGFDPVARGLKKNEAPATATTTTTTTTTTTAPR